MYFQSRAEAGVMLAERLAAYRYENTVIVALTDGAVQVGIQIAAELHATLSMLLTQKIELPGEDETIGMLNQDGVFVYNGMFSAGQIEGYYTEYHGYLEEEKRRKNSEMNKLLGSGGIVNEDMLCGQNVILLSDGLVDGTSLDAAAEFLKPLQLQRLIVATPIASIKAADRAHLLADELHILGVTENFLGVDHYYDVNDVPSHEEVVKMLNDFVLSWR